MSRDIKYIGMDVHKEAIVIAGAHVIEYGERSKSGFFVIVLRHIMP